MKKQKNYSADIGKGLAMLSQLAVSILTPMLLFIFGARFLVKKFDIGSWLIPLALIIGLASGMMSAWSMVDAIMKQQQKEVLKRQKDTGEEALRQARDRLAQDKNFKDNIQKNDNSEDFLDED